MSPVTEQQIGTIPAATREDIERTLVSCQQAGLEWRKTSAWSRAAILRHTADLIRSRIDEIAKIMSTETGKPLIEAKAEVGASADQFEWYSEEGKRAYGQIIPSRLPDERLSVVYQPVGPCLALSQPGTFRGCYQLVKLLLRLLLVVQSSHVLPQKHQGLV